MITEQNTLSSKPWGLWIFCAALCVRLIYFAWSQSSPFLYQLSTDEAFYVNYAHHLLNGQHYPYANFMDPLLSYLLAIPMLLTDNMHIVRLCFVLLDSLNALLIYSVCLQLTASKKAAVFCGFIYSIYSLTLIYSVFITKATPLITLLLGTTLVLLQAMRHASRARFLWAGVLSALLLFFGASFALLGIGYLLILLTSRQWRLHVPSFLAGYILLIAAQAMVFNALDTDKSIFPTNGGIVFYISNHAANEWGTHLHPAFVKEATPTGIYHAFRDQALKEDPLIKTDKEVSAFWYHKAWEENKAEPEKALRRIWHKSLLLFSNDEISQNYYLPYIKEQTLKQIPLPGFALLLGFGITGLLMFFTRDIRLALLLAPIVVVVITCELFFVSARMRFPMVPFLMLGCSFWLADRKSISKKTILAMVLALGITASSFAVDKLTTKPATIQDQYNLAVTMVNAKMFTEAEILIEEILQHESAGKYLYLLAVIKSYQGHCAEALPIYDKLLLMQSDIPDLSFNRNLCFQAIQENR